MALNQIARRLRERHILAVGLFFGYLMNFADQRSQITGVIAFMRSKLPEWLMAVLLLYFAVSILWLLLRKGSPFSMVIAMIPQFAYMYMGAWWVIESRNSAVQAPLTGFGIHLGFFILSFGLVLLRLQNMAKGQSLDDITVLPDFGDEHDSN